jgi:cell division protein FtsW (lipid II flippase)
MKTKISIILLLISLALLIIYGVDVIVSQGTSHDEKSSTLHLSAAVRGGVLGGGAVILSIVAFAISVREKSALVVLLLLVNGGIIIAGMIGLITKEGSTGSSTVYGTIGLGILLMALGAVKIFFTRKR